MGTQQQSVYQQVIERTKAMSFRTSVLINNIDRRESDLKQPAEEVVEAIDEE
jgi:translation initiation factor 3 subunit E